jgi:hypothetical protein
MVAGYPAVEVEFAYSMPLPLNSLHPQWTVIQQRRIFFRRGDQIYELRYVAPAEEYETGLEAFQTLVDSLAFSGEPADVGAYQPVEATVPQAVREVSSGYETMRDAERGARES